MLLVLTTGFALATNTNFLLAVIRSVGRFVKWVSPDQPSGPWDVTLAISPANLMKIMRLAGVAAVTAVTTNR